MRLPSGCPATSRTAVPIILRSTGRAWTATYRGHEPPGWAALPPRLTGAIRIWKSVKTGCRPPRSLPAARRLAIESVIRSRSISSSIWAKATMTVKTIEPIGVWCPRLPHRGNHPQPCSPAVQLFGEGEHVLRGPAQTVQRGDNQRVALLEGGHRFVELGTGATCSRHSMIDIEVIAPHAGMQGVKHLAVCVLLPHRRPCAPDQLPHAHPVCLATNVE